MTITQTRGMMTALKAFASPNDFDAAFAWLVVQPGVDKSRIGARGGSCGVNNAVKLASRHSEVRSLVLLAGGTD